MTVPLIVLLGAGASRSSGNYADTPQPPLTVELFDEERYGHLLETYDLAHQAGRFIARQRAQDSALALEHAIHELRISEFPHYRHMAVAVPFYLQHLLHELSDRLYRKAFRYDHLIERLLRLPYVYFVTLNYDVLLDRRLASYHPLNSLSDYISGKKNWSLIKLHGSVNWYRTAFDHLDPASPPFDVDMDVNIGCVPPSASLEQIRNTSAAETDRYPALALPEGPEDELVAPTEHVDFLKQELSNAHQIDLLVIGYSGLDEAVLELLSDRKSDVRRLTVVDADLPAASVVLRRLKQAGINAIWPNPFRGDFANWADEGHLDQLVDEYDGPYGQ